MVDVGIIGRSEDSIVPERSISRECSAAEV